MHSLVSKKDYDGLDQSLGERPGALDTWTFLNGCFLNWRNWHEVWIYGLDYFVVKKDIWIRLRGNKVDLPNLWYINFAISSTWTSVREKTLLCRLQQPLDRYHRIFFKNVEKLFFFRHKKVLLFSFPKIYNTIAIFLYLKKQATFHFFLILIKMKYWLRTVV